MSIDLDTLQLNVFVFLHATSEADAVFFTADEVKGWLSEHLKRAAQKYGLFVLRDTASVALAQGTAVYDAPLHHLDTIHVAVQSRSLTPETTSELDQRGGLYESDQVAAGKFIIRFYSDKIGTNKIAFQPVPGPDQDGLIADVIYHGFPCVDPNGSQIVNAPKWLGDYLEFAATSDCYEHDGKMQMPEVAAAAEAFAGFYSAVMQQVWGPAQ